MFTFGPRIESLEAAVQDGIALEGLDEKWSVDGHTLLTKLRGLNYAQTVALLDALERWWGGPNARTLEGFIAVGLVPAPVDVEAVTSPITITKVVSFNADEFDPHNELDVKNYRFSANVAEIYSPPGQVFVMDEEEDD